MYSRSLKRMMGLTATYFESGEGLGVSESEGKSWRRCQKLMQSRNSKDYFLRRLGTHGKHGNRKLIFTSSLGDFTHLILYVMRYLTLILLILCISTDLLNAMQDYGVKQAPKRKDISETKSSLAPQLLELMKMLFNVETYKCVIASFPMSCLPTFFLLLY